MCKQQRRNETQNDVENCDRAITVTLKIRVSAIPAAVVHWYRETKDSPLHALSAELWMGNDRVAKIEPVQGLGLTELQVKTLMLRILNGFSQHTGLNIERFRTSVELHPLNCPTRPCPLHPQGD